MSDPKADKAAAAMDVGVGHLSDPDDLPGCAHFWYVLVPRIPLKSMLIPGKRASAIHGDQNSIFFVIP